MNTRQITSLAILVVIALVLSCRCNRHGRCCEAPLGDRCPILFADRADVLGPLVSDCRPSSWAGPNGTVSLAPDGAEGRLMLARKEH